MSFEDMADAAANPKNLPIEFTFEESLVRTVVKDGEPWFVAKDICEILDHSNHRMAVSALDEDEKGVSIADTPGGPQEMVTVNESGLYSLIFTSRKPEAKRFRKWVTSEVLPAIRKTGRYCGYSADDPDPVVVWAKLLGVRTSDVVTKGFGVGYLLGGPIHPSDYLVHNHRVLCHAVKGLASCWPGLQESDYDPRWSKREWSAREFAFHLQIADWLADQFLETPKTQL
jgi:prophage antirepressor-like protein